MLLYIGYQSGTYVIYWLPEWNCSYILVRGVELNFYILATRVELMLYICYRSGTVVIYWLEERTNVAIYWLPVWN